MDKLVGLGVALVTPFNEDLTIDFVSLTNLIEFNISNGVKYFIVLGTTAETATLTTDEKEAVVKHVVKVNNGRIPLVLGIGGNNTAEVVASINNTNTSAFEAILSVSPYYNKPNQEGIYQHYKALASTGKNIILYNVPGRTGQNVAPSTTIRLANDFSNIIMIKEASSNISQYFDIIRHKPNDFKVVSGDDELALAATLAGASGVISVIGQAFPKEFSKMINLALEENNKDAYEIHYKMVDIIRLIFAEGNPTGIKQVLSELGLIKNNLRLPMTSASQVLADKIREEMKKI